jgi:hypothetical protein
MGPPQKVIAVKNKGGPKGIEDHVLPSEPQYDAPADVSFDVHGFSINGGYINN